MYKEFEFKNVYVSITEQWTELFSSSVHYMWKNFKIFQLEVEYRDVIYPKGSFEVIFFLFGFGVIFQYVSNKEKTPVMLKLESTVDDWEEGKLDTTPVFYFDEFDLNKKIKDILVEFQESNTSLSSDYAINQITDKIVQTVRTHRRTDV